MLKTSICDIVPTSNSHLLKLNLSLRCQKTMQACYRELDRNKSLLFFERNRPVGALVDWKWLQEALAARRQLEEMEALPG